MKEVAKKFHQLFRGSSKEEQSMLNALSKILSISQLEDVIRRTADHRTLVQTAAKALGLIEEDLVCKVAAGLGLPYAEVVDPIDFEKCKSMWTVAELRRAGAMPLVSGDRIVGIICVDPILLGDLAKRVEKLAVVIGSWVSIAKALDESERLSRVVQEQKRLREQEKLSRAARKVIGLMMKEVESYDRECVDIEILDRGVLYRFLTTDGRTATGTIHSSMKEILVQIITDMAKRGVTSFEVSKEVVREGISFEVLRPGSRFRLSWQTPKIQTNEVLEADDRVEDILREARAILDGTGEKANRKTEEVKNSFASEAATSIGEVSAEKEETAGCVLLVDDNVTFLKVLDRFFDRKKIHTILAENGEEALRVLHSEEKTRPDVIVCDIHMPHMNGAQFLDLLRKESQFDDISVVMLTSDADVEMEVRFLTKGVDAFVTKDEDPRVLAAHVERLIANSSPRHGKREAA